MPLYFHTKILSIFQGGKLGLMMIMSTSLRDRFEAVDCYDHGGCGLNP